MTGSPINYLSESSSSIERCLRVEAPGLARLLTLELRRLRVFCRFVREREREDELRDELESEPEESESESLELELEDEDDDVDVEVLLRLLLDSPVPSPNRAFSLASRILFAVPLLVVNSSGTSTDGFPSILSFSSSFGFSSCCVREGLETYGRVDLHS